MRSRSFDRPDGDNTIAARQVGEPEPPTRHLEMHQHVVARHREAAVAAHACLDLVPQSGVRPDQRQPRRRPALDALRFIGTHVDECTTNT